MKVLFVDDEEGIRDQAKIFLEWEEGGFDLTPAANGEEALELIESKDFDVVVAEYKLSGMNGIELLKKTKETEDDLPFIMLTEKGGEDVAIKALNLGADKYFKKISNYEGMYKNLSQAIKEVKKKRERRKTKDREDYPPEVSDLLNDYPPEVLYLLDEMLNGDIEEIEPVIFSTEGSSTSYPSAEKILHIPTVEVVEVLESLVEDDYLKKNFYDQFLVCPGCKSSNIKISALCPNCGSLKTQKKEIIEHLTCGYQAGTEDFEREDGRYFCAKCNKELRAIGVDYSKMSNIGICENCGEYFDELDYILRCDPCEKDFRLEEGEKNKIYSYELNERKKAKLRRKLKEV